MTKQQLFDCLLSWYNLVASEGSADPEDAEAIKEIEALLASEPSGDGAKV